METQEVTCSKCSEVFTASRKPVFIKGYPRRSGLGFMVYQCPKCSEKTLYPLTSGYRVTYGVLTLIFGLLVISALKQGHFPIPGFLAIVSIWALIKDQAIRNSLSLATNNKKVSPKKGVLCLNPALTLIDPDVKVPSEQSVVLPALNEPTIQVKLQSKPWYRLLQVVYGILFVSVLACAFTLIYKENKPKRVFDVSQSSILCANGKVFTGKDLGIGGDTGSIAMSFDWFNLTTNTSSIKRLCILGTPDESVILSFDQYKEFSLPKEEVYVTNEVYITHGSWMAVVSYGVFSLIGLIFTFWIGKRVFLYIYSGK